MNTILAVLTGFLTLGLVMTATAADSPLFLDASQPREARVEDLLGRLTLEEKVALLHADSKFSASAVPRLGIPRRWMSDGPHGVREEIGPDDWKPAGRTDDFSTCMPCGIALGATWDPDLARKEGEAIGQEARARGKHIMLGPGLNLQRTPLCGRNFEYMGEDPFLTSRMAVGYIVGEQSQGVASCAKHFAVNNQETERTSVSVELDERALRELYLPAFQAAVKGAGVLAVMGAYNRLRGQYCCENDYLLNRILKGEWGFQGLVVSDWNGVHHTAEAALNGLDLEMGTDQPYHGFYLADAYLEGLRDGTYPMAGLDDKVRRNLRVMFATHMFDPGPKGSLNTPEHQATARHVAEEAMVLLKNDNNLLPLDESTLKSVAVIGANATELQAYGGNSSGIKALYEITPLQGILNRVGGKVTVTYAKGYGGINGLALAGQAVQAARQAEVVIFVAGLGHAKGQDTEDSDRKDLKLPDGQDELIARVSEANPKMVVVMVSGSPVEMPWLSKAPAVLQAWYSGTEGGNALAGILFGDVNPSGKLPCTFPKRLEDTPVAVLGEYPGKGGVVHYTEGLMVGYRYYDTKKVEPLFPFGHGLSYTHFTYSNFHVAEGAPATVQFDLSNRGSRAGAEVAQVYIHQVQPSLPRPLQELKGFRKISLAPGATQTVSIPLEIGAFSYYDPAKGGWLAEKGQFEIRVGSSSRDIRWSGKFTLEH